MRELLLDQKASVINISSVSGLRFFRGSERSSYAASKAALNMLTLYMAAEYMPFKVRINGHAPNRFDGSQAKNVVRVAMEMLKSGKTGCIHQQN
ncbi:SDR family oxidoreductase [Mesorhizobium sp. DCY119]|nr:SDR family oxidoreductase [Mesorhizobium sp. DCY119]